MGNKNTKADRSSDEQAKNQPEPNQSSSAPATSSLHQGQGPDFQTQDDTVQDRNPGIRQMKKQPNEKKEQPFNESLGTDNEKPASVDANDEQDIDTDS